VSELEVINDLFRGRVAELEASEQDARRNEAVAREAESRIRIDLEEAKRKIEKLESELGEYRDLGHKHKKVRLSDIVDESRASTPLSDPSQSV
jgi:GATA-binding protein